MGRGNGVPPSARTRRLHQLLHKGSMEVKVGPDGSYPRQETQQSSPGRSSSAPSPVTAPTHTERVCGADATWSLPVLLRTLLSASHDSHTRRVFICSRQPPQHHLQLSLSWDPARRGGVPPTFSLSLSLLVDFQDYPKHVYSKISLGLWPFSHTSRAPDTTREAQIHSMLSHKAMQKTTKPAASPHLNRPHRDV